MAPAANNSWSKSFFSISPGNDVKKCYQEKMNLELLGDPYYHLETKEKGSSAFLSVEWTNWLSYFDAWSYT